MCAHNAALGKALSNSARWSRGGPPSCGQALLAAPAGDRFCHLVGVHLLEPVAVQLLLVKNRCLLIILLLGPDGAAAVGAVQRS